MSISRFNMRPTTLRSLRAFANKSVHHEFYFYFFYILQLFFIIGEYWTPPGAGMRKCSVCSVMGEYKKLHTCTVVSSWRVGQNIKKNFPGLTMHA